MVEQLPGIVSQQVQAIRDLKIDKVTVWDGGNNADGKTATSNFLSGLINSLPPVHDLAKQAGVELPEYLGQLKPQHKPLTHVEPPTDVTQ